MSRTSAVQRASRAAGEADAACRSPVGARGDRTLDTTASATWRRIWGLMCGVWARGERRGWHGSLRGSAQASGGAHPGRGRPTTVDGATAGVTDSVDEAGVGLSGGGESGRVVILCESRLCQSSDSSMPYILRREYHLLEQPCGGSSSPAGAAYRWAFHTLHGVPQRTDMTN